MDSVPEKETANGSRLGLKTGQVLVDRYEIRQLIGTGHTCAVYSAKDLRSNNEVAIQVILAELSGDDQVREDVHREARMAFRLDHVGLVKTIEAFNVDGLLVIVMEWLDEPTLCTRMTALWTKRQRFSVDEVVRLGRTLCDTLACVHESAVHGGVTPANIFLCKDGRVKLSGFGASRLPTTRQSHAGMGSMAVASYMAPEQLTGSADVDHRADQYALAAVLYEMLTGQAPVGRLKSARQLRPETPRALSCALDRALSPDPAERFTDIDELARALTGRTPFGPRSVRFWGLAAVIIIAVVLGASYPKWVGTVTSTPPPRAHDPNAPIAARNALSQAVALAVRYEKLVGVLPGDSLSDGADQAREAISAGQRHLEESSYAAAEESFGTAIGIYEDRIEAATRRFSAEPARVATAARDLVEKWDELRQQIEDRVTESARRLGGFERAFRADGSEGERAAATSREQEAAAECQLLNRLKSLARTHVFSASQRGEINAGLQQADVQLEAGDFEEALSLYAGAKERLDQQLVWLNRAELALREEAALALRLEQSRSALSPTVLELPSVTAAIDEARTYAALGNEELTAGRVSEAREQFALASASLATTTDAAVAALLARAETFDRSGDGTGAILTLDELLALSPNHTDALALRAKVLAYRTTNSVEMDLAFIPPGEFLMGSPQTEVGRDKDERQRTVRVPSGFYLSTTEVTQSQWSAVMDANPSKWVGDDLPVESVTWQDAQAFCRKLSEREGRRYRLPTETEWEYACRAGTTTSFVYGETMTTNQANYDGRSKSTDAGEDLFRAKTVPVASFPQNPLGLFDMHGNVWEWCVAEGSQASEIPARLTAEPPPIEGRVLRGGSWRNRARYCRSANRVTDTEDSKLANVGFRVVLESR